jgi:hypothetical protein
MPSTLILQSSSKYIGPAPYPYVPFNGATWTELDGLGNLVQEWFWSGTFWLSRQEFWQTLTGSPLGLTSSNSVVDFAPPPGFDVFFTRLSTSFRANAIQTVTNFYTMSLSRVTAGDVSTQIVNINTQGAAANINIFRTTLVNININMVALNVVSFRLSETRTATVIARSSNSYCSYRLSRI